MRLRRPRPIALTAAAVALALFAWWAWGSLSDRHPDVQMIDGLVMGPVSDCAGLKLTPARCQRALVYARSGLDVQHPGHAPIAREVLHADTNLMFVDGKWQVGVRSGEFVATVEFDLADGTRRAQAVACGVWQPGDLICDPAVP